MAVKWYKDWFKPAYAKFFEEYKEHTESDDDE